jgi:YVTN family beta-propeller protein
VPSRVCRVLFLSGMASASLAAPAPEPSYRQVAQIPGPDGGWDLTSVDPVARRLYVARSGAIMAVDLTSGAVTPAVVPAQRGHAALAIPGTSEVISTNGSADSATIFDGRTGKVRAVVPVGKKPDAVAYDPATRTLWVMNSDSGDISVVDPRSAKVLATVAVGGSLELGEADGEGRLFVNVEDHNDVAVLDTRARRLVSRFPLAGCDGPTGIAYDPDKKLLVSACANGRAIVSTRDGRQVANLVIGPRPDGALFDRRRHVALIPSGGDGTLAVIDLRGKPKVVATIPTAKGARTAALDEATGRVYLSAAGYLPAVGKERPTMVPGSYRVLVLEPIARRRW